jgi:putative transposase
MVGAVEVKQRRAAVNRRRPSLSVARQCKLLDISRSGLYYQPVAVSDEDLSLMKLIDCQYMVTPFYGTRKMAVWLKSKRHGVNRKHVRRLMQLMGLKAIYRHPRTSPSGRGNKIYPYLLTGMAITRPNQVWCADITYIPMAHGFMYLVVIMDWYSRYVLAWRLSNTLDADFCVEALGEALRKGKPDVFNTDQGSQFTGKTFTGLLEQHGIKISMDGKGSYRDNLFNERLWRTVKYEEVLSKSISEWERRSNRDQ